MLTINWGLIPKKYKYAAMDCDGQIWVFTDSPVWCSVNKEWGRGNSADWDILCDSQASKDDDFELAIDERDYD